ncbi:MAG: type II secretion system protein, partial [Planctomycetota bacterium]
MTSRRRQIGARAAGRGFTLAELIVATTVTVLLAGSTAGILRSVVAARQRADRQSALQAEARAAVESIAVALRNAHRTAGDQAILEGKDGWR